MAKHKPIEFMHFYYGERYGLHVCAECCNFTSIRSGSKKLFKCKAYGVTCSSGSDWAKSGLLADFLTIPLNPLLFRILKSAFLHAELLKKTIRFRLMDRLKLGE